MPRGGGPRHCRQFSCPVCEPASSRYDVKRWHKVVPDDHPYSTCNTCGEEYEACPIGQEFGVGVCKFVCDECGRDSTYSVVCRMIDMAECYQCYSMNSAVEFTPRRRIDRKTDKKHSCSRCDNGRKKCPNLHR